MFFIEARQMLPLSKSYRPVWVILPHWTRGHEVTCNLLSLIRHKNMRSMLFEDHIM